MLEAVPFNVSELDVFDEKGENIDTSGSKRNPVAHIRAKASTL
jgi:hypothetical protein